MTQSRRVQRSAVVAGAGIAGLTAADVLSRAGWRVTVLERAGAPRDEGYMIDFFGPGFDTAERIGLLPALRSRAADIRTVEWVDVRGHTRARMDYDRVRRGVSGRLISLMRPDVEHALRERLGTAADVRYGAEVRGFVQDGERVLVRLADESEIDADVLIGADGIHSAVRLALFPGRVPALRHLGYHTCAYTIRDETLHRRLAGRFTMTDTVERTVGLYATSDGHVAMWGIHRVADSALPADRRGELQERYRGLGRDVDAVLALCPASSELYYDQVAQVVLPEWSKGRVALVGDACGAVSLLAGQGASLAVAGGAELARRLDAAADVASGIAEYERVMRPVIEEKQAAGQRAAASFVPRSAFGLWFRRISLRMLSVPGLDRIVARGIVGKSSEVFRA